MNVYSLGSVRVDGEDQRIVRCQGSVALFHDTPLIL